MSCWFLLSTALLLQSTNLYHRSCVFVQANRHPWTKIDIHHHPTIQTHNNHNHAVAATTNNNYSQSVLKLLTLRAGDISSDEESSANNPRRRRKRKRVRIDPPLSTDLEGKDDENVDDAAEESTQQPQSGAEPAEKKGKRRRRRLFSRNKVEENDDGEPSTEVDIDNNREEDVAITSSKPETGKRIKKRRRKKVVDEDAAEVELEQEIELEESVPSCSEDVGVEEDSIPDVGGVEAVVDEVADDKNEVDNNMEEATKSTTRMKKRRKKKRGTSTIVKDTVPDEVTEEEIPEPEAIDAEPLPVETPNEEVNRSKKRKEKKRRTNVVVEDSIDLEQQEETSETIDASQVSSIEIATEETAKKRKRKRRVTSKTVQDDASDDVTNEEETTTDVIDASPHLSIDASVEIPSEEIVPESIGSSIEVDESLKVTPTEDEEVEELQSEVVIDSVEKEAEPASDEIDSITSIDDKEGDDEYVVEPTDEVPAEEENEVVEELPSVDTVDSVEKDAEPTSDDEISVTNIETSTDKESDDENIVESTDEVPAEAENEEAEELVSEDVVDSVEEMEEPASDDETSITIIDDNEGDDEHIVTPIEEVPAEADTEEATEMPAEDSGSAYGAEPEVIDGSVEIQKEDFVSESGDASIEVEEDIHAEAFEEAEEGSDGMSAIINNEEEEEGDERVQQESNEDYPSDEKESKTPAILSEESVASKDENPISIEEVTSKDTNDESTRDEEDGDASDKNEVDEETEQSSSREVSKTTQPMDNPIESESHESETEGAVTLEESHEEENAAAEEVSSAQLDQSNIDADDITEGQSKIIELEKMEDDCLTISVVTWNLAEASFSEKEASFFKKFRKGSSKNGSDLVLIGAQECEDIKPRRSEGHRSRHLRRVGIQMLGKDYVPLAIHSLGGIQMALYCHRDVLGDVEMINIADVTCGVGNVFHNKGAIGVYLKMKRLSGQKNGVAKSSRILFVTGHLAAHVKNVDARNDDFKRIISGLEAQAPARFLRPRRNPDGSPTECDGSYLMKSMDHVFFAGDLNYRVDLPREYVERCIIDINENQSCDKLDEADALMNELLRRDQLLQTIASGRAFPQFNEGKITFLPTFKFDKGTQNYDTSHKQRVPAWTDRILFRSSKVNVLEYQSVPAAMHSDHRPVFGTYQLGWGVATKDTSRGGKRGRRNRKK